MPRYSHEDFRRAVLDEFPALAEAFEEDSSLPYIEMGAFATFTQRAKGRGDWATYQGCVQLAHRFFVNADEDLKNAFYVAYLEHLAFDGQRGPQAWKRLSTTLRAAWRRIADSNARASALPHKPKKRRS